MAYNFSTGVKVELELFNPKTEQEIKLKTILERSAEDEYFLLHSPIHEGRIFLIQNETKLKLFFSSSGADTDKCQVYSFSGKVIARKMVDNIPMLVVQRESEIEKVERRDYYRLHCVKEMQVSLAELKTKIDILTVDISIGGIRFLSDHKFKKNQKLKAYVCLDDQEVIELKAMVIDSELSADSSYDYQTRIKFADISGEDRSYLVKHINAIQADHIKKEASETYEKNINNILPQFNSEKLDAYSSKRKFQRNMGYFKGLIAVGIVLTVAIFFIAQPNNEYPIAKLLGIVYNNGWSWEFLVAGIVLSIGVAVLSISVYSMEKNNSDQEKNDKLMLLSCCFAIAMMILNIYHFFSNF